MMKVIRLLDGIEMNGVSVSAVSYLQTLLRDVEKGVSRPGVLAPVPDHASSNATKEGKTEKSKQNLKNAAKDLGKWRMQVHHTGL